MFQSARVVLSTEGVFCAKPEGGLLPSAGAGGRVPLDAYALRSGLLVPRQHQRQVPQWILQPWLGG